jgi:hypothetical protein
MQFITDCEHNRDHDAPSASAPRYRTANLFAQPAHQETREEKIFTEMTELSYRQMHCLISCVASDEKMARNSGSRIPAVLSLENLSVEKTKISDA